MELQHEKSDIYVDVYGVEYVLIGYVENKPHGNMMALIHPCGDEDGPWYVVDNEVFKTSFMRI